MKIDLIEEDVTDLIEVINFYLVNANDNIELKIRLMGLRAELQNTK